LVFFTLLANIFYILSYCGLAIFNKVRVSALFGYCWNSLLAIGGQDDGQSRVVQMSTRFGKW